MLLICSSDVKMVLYRLALQLAVSNIQLTTYIHCHIITPLASPGSMHRDYPPTLSHAETAAQADWLANCSWLHQLTGVGKTFLPSFSAYPCFTQSAMRNKGSKSFLLHPQNHRHRTSCPSVLLQSLGSARARFDLFGVPH